MERDGEASQAQRPILGARTSPPTQPMPRTFHSLPIFLEFPKKLKSFLKANFSSKVQLLGGGMSRGGPGRKAGRQADIFSTTFPVSLCLLCPSPTLYLIPHSIHCSWQGASIVPAASGLPSSFPPRGGDPQQPRRLRARSPLLAPPGPGKLRVWVSRGPTDSECH